MVELTEEKKNQMINLPTIEIRLFNLSLQLKSCMLNTKKHILSAVKWNVSDVFEKK